jgi:hypothetical protein
MADGLGNVTEKVTTIAKTLHEHIAEGNCTDHKGQFIPNGLLYTPRGADACRVCTCASGDPILCRTVLCAPPTHCNSIKVRPCCPIRKILILTNYFLKKPIYIVEILCNV